MDLKSYHLCINTKKLNVKKMFDEDQCFNEKTHSEETIYHIAKDSRKLKKILFNQSKDLFSDPVPHQYQYYKCVNEMLSNVLISDAEIDGKIED